jgi:hypothetical protein
MSTAILIYTHDEYSFLWTAMFTLCNKYIKDVDIHLLYNDDADIVKINELVPSNFIKHTYNTSLIWTKRVLKGLQEIENEYILFLHEDWFPIDNVFKEVLDSATTFMKTKNCQYLLSYYNWPVEDEDIFSGYENYYYRRQMCHIFQPAIWNRHTFINFCTVFDKKKNENEHPDCHEYTKKINPYFVYNKTNYNTLRTMNSLIFPHYHVLSEGLWNFKKYPGLKAFLEEFGIDTSTRGVHTWWELDTQ